MRRQSDILRYTILTLAVSVALGLPLLAFLIRGEQSPGGNGAATEARETPPIRSKPVEPPEAVALEAAPKPEEPALTEADDSPTTAAAPAPTASIYAHLVRLITGKSPDQLAAEQEEPEPPLIAAEVRGTVYGPDGAPVAGAEVRMWPAITDGVFPGEKRPANEEETTTTTDAAGEYVMPRLLKGPRVLVARADHDEAGLLADGLNRFTLAPGEVKEGIDLKLKEGDKFVVKIVDGEGTPIEGIEVRYYSRQPLIEKFEISDDGGIIEFSPIYAESDEINIVFQGDETYLRNYIRLGPERESPYTLKLTKGRRVIISAIDEASGLPIGKYRFNLSFYGFGINRWLVASRFEIDHKHSLADSPLLDILDESSNNLRRYRNYVDRVDGTIVLDKLQAEKYYIEVEAAEFRITGDRQEPISAKLTGKGAAEFEVVEGIDGDTIVPVLVNRGHTVQGVAVDQKSGKPLVSGEIFLVRVDMETEQRKINIADGSTGRFLFEHVSSGSYKIYARSKEYCSIAPYEFKIDTDNESREHRIAVPQAANIFGKVVGSLETEGEARMMVAHRVPHLDAPHLNFFHKYKINEDGSYRIIGAAPTKGFVIVFQRDENYFPKRITSREIALHPGEEQELNISLDDQIEVSGKILLNGSPPKPEYPFLQVGHEADPYGLYLRDKIVIDNMGMYRTMLSPGLNGARLFDLKGGPPVFEIPPSPSVQTLDIKFDTVDLHVKVVGLEPAVLGTLEYSLNGKINFGRKGIFFVVYKKEPEFVVPRVVTNRYMLTLTTTDERYIADPLEVDLAQTNEVVFTLREQESQ